MKKIGILFILFSAASFAQTTATSEKPAPEGQTSKKAASKKKSLAVTAQNPARFTIPKEAVLDPKDGNYHYTDKNGRKWVYMNTPMGPSRWEDKGDAAPAVKADNRFSQDPNMKAIDEGDTVKFVHVTPFGNQTWTKKKSELTDDERSMLAGDQNGRTQSAHD